MPWRGALSRGGARDRQHRDGPRDRTADKDYNLIWYVEACPTNALRLESSIQDAEREKDTEVVELFRKAQADSPKGAGLGKQLLRRRLND